MSVWAWWSCCVQTIFADSTSKRNGFSLVTNGRGFQLYADSPEEKRQWKDALLAAIRLAQQGAAAGGGSTTKGAAAAASSAAPATALAATHQQETRTFYVVSREEEVAVATWCCLWGGEGREQAGWVVEETLEDVTDAPGVDSGATFGLMWA